LFKSGRPAKNGGKNLGEDGPQTRRKKKGAAVLGGNRDGKKGFPSVSGRNEGKKWRAAEIQEENDFSDGVKGDIFSAAIVSVRISKTAIGVRREGED